MNVMQKPKIERVVLSAGAVGDNLTKAKKLLELITKKKARIVSAGPKRRIPAFGVKPGLELGVQVTLRGKEAFDVLQRLLGGIENTIKKKKITPNHFSFGMKEYIDIPGMEYVREIGIRGFNTTVVFQKAGLRVKKKKIKTGKFPKRQFVTEQEIMKFMEDNFKTNFI